MHRFLDHIAWPIRTERLVLRPAVPRDAEATWQIRCIESVSHWITAAAVDHDGYVDEFRSPAWRGWCLHPDQCGRGYATEAVRALLAACFDQLGVRRVVAECFADNESSWRLMERVGMRREAHTVRDALHRTGKWMDSFAYAILAEEWQRTDLHE